MRLYSTSNFQNCRHGEWYSKEVLIVLCGHESLEACIQLGIAT